MQVIKQLFGVVSFIVASLFIGIVMLNKIPWPVELRDIYKANTIQETGAPNIVSAIYLGYRAYDTLGETIVLFVAALGTLYLLRYAQKTLPMTADCADGKLSYKNRRTSVIKVIVSKLGPAVIIFGMYIMAFGYRSPGGGFQGGSVFASGIVILSFIYIDKKSQYMTMTRQLKKIEIFVFVILLISFFLGLFTRSLFLKNPFTELKPVVYISILNIVIGIKVGLNMGLLCIAMLRGELYE